jgi:hypothetical protein
MMSIKDYDVSLHLNVIESAILKLAKPYLQIRDNERHTFNAIEFALKLLEIYDAERTIVIPAMILHDVGWSKVSMVFPRQIQGDSKRGAQAEADGRKKITMIRFK